MGRAPTSKQNKSVALKLSALLASPGFGVNCSATLDRQSFRDTDRSTHRAAYELECGSFLPDFQVRLNWERAGTLLAAQPIATGPSETLACCPTTAVRGQPILPRMARKLAT
jgi:hypothetical protein